MTVAILAALAKSSHAQGSQGYIAPDPPCYAPTVTVYDTETQISTLVETVSTTVVDNVVLTETAYVTETLTEREVQSVTEVETVVATETEEVRRLSVGRLMSTVAKISVPKLFDNRLGLIEPMN